jgi:hypothetical protein
MKRACQRIHPLDTLETLVEKYLAEEAIMVCPYLEINPFELDLAS